MIQMLNFLRLASDMSAKDTFTAEVPQEIMQHPNFEKWRSYLDGSQDVKVEAVTEKIKEFGLITNVKSLGDGLYEIKWKSGLRIYFAIVLSEGQKTLLLLGSGKGKEQQRTISAS